MNKLLNGLSMIREEEGYIVTCNIIDNDMYQVVYVNLNNGKTKVSNVKEEKCKEILKKEYGIIVDMNVIDNTKVIGLIPNKLGICIKQGDTEISRGYKKKIR